MSADEAASADEPAERDGDRPLERGQVGVGVRRQEPAHPAEQRDLPGGEPDRDEHGGEQRRDHDDDVPDRRGGRVAEIGAGLAQEALDGGDRVATVGQAQAERLEDRPEGVPDLGQDRRQVVDERHRRVEQGDDRPADDDDRHDDRQEIRDGDGQATRLDRQMVLEPADGRVEDVGHQPGDEQDHGRTGQRSREARDQRQDRGEEGDHDEPEDEPRLAPRHDVPDRRPAVLHAGYLRGRVPRTTGPPGPRPRRQPGSVARRRAPCPRAGPGRS